MAPLLACCFTLTIVPIKDYGTHGHTFPVEEENLLEYLENQTGQPQVQEYEKIIHHYPVKNLKQAKAYSISYFDPTITIQQEIKDEAGNLIIEKGTTYNPLHHYSLSTKLLFFDGDNVTHLDWARSLGEQTKWILVAGHPFVLEEQENRPIYFDQNGLLTQKLNIKEIPAAVSQAGDRLMIEIFPLRSSRCGN